MDWKSSQIQRLESRIEILPWSGCWVWLYGLNSKGYGIQRVDSIYIQAHRLSYELYIGPIPRGLMVLHTCDVKPCNPLHLYLGTHIQNMIDAMNRGQMFYRNLERSKMEQ